MELKRILTGIDGLKAKGNLDLDVPNVTIDSRAVGQGDMFIAINGFEVDGHRYIPMALKKGAKVILIEETKVNDVAPIIPPDVTLLATQDTRKAESICACNFYDQPSRKVKLIGVTGTKGKTTTTFMIKKILEKQGIKTGIIGTIAEYSGDRKIEDSDRTSPDAIHLQYLLSQMVNDGCQAVVMEVSSQSLKLHRVDGCEFDMAIFTNFSEDHIGKREHPNMEDYFNSKLLLFQKCNEGFINADDLYALRIPKLAPNCNIKTYGIDNQCDLLAKDITITNSYVDFRVKINGKNERIKAFIPGRFSVYNCLSAICIAEKMGCSTECIKQALEEVRVPGRSELVDNDLDLTLMIDYAHSPESLQSILQAVKSYTRGKVISVFGCGGDRDTSKRPQMGEISGKIADYTIITSDNPRTEDPESIIKQIEDGIKKTNGKYECIVDRTEAIRKAIEIAKNKDIVVMAGKGHETYQEINHIKNPYDERVIIKEIISQMKKKKQS
ncbi:MAG: UDP-N-acetylmuramoyl-L-alanyl-D-glutamate--2,6-diaminopimelate ligase [Clostridia bacterium]|nr:UDP-N-acetylmuramoyl-L-alanyl-D-glutamate--2,6-diaminopimelate ligase [Clostridia bacterium]